MGNGYPLNPTQFNSHAFSTHGHLGACRGACGAAHRSIMLLYQLYERGAAAGSRSFKGVSEKETVKAAIIKKRQLAEFRSFFMRKRYHFLSNMKASIGCSALRARCTIILLPTFCISTSLAIWLKKLAA